MNGAKPGASACFWVKGGAGVLGGRSVNQSINQSLGDRRRRRRREESGERVLALLSFFNFDLKQREKCFRPLRSQKRRGVPSHGGGGLVSWGSFSTRK